MKKWMAMAAALALVGAAVPHGFAENVYTPGTYAAQAKGFGGVVSVSVTALMLSLTVRLYRRYHTLDIDRITLMMKGEDD